jgi:hypothetical protein
MGLKAMIMGLAETAVKNEKGARLFDPSMLRVEITAMGRGIMDPIKNL